MNNQIIPIINQLYWRRAGGEYQLIRQTRTSETVFFIATQAEYFAIQHQGQAAKIAELRDALDKIDAVTKHLMVTNGYKMEQDWLGAFIFKIQDIARALVTK